MGQIVSNLFRNLASRLTHFLRLGGYAPFLLYCLFRYPKFTVMLCLFYWGFLSRTNLWADLIWNFVLYGKPDNFTQLEKSCSLDENRSYLFAIHPHGLMVEGCFYSTALNFKRFRELFPHLRVTLAAGDEVRLLPIFREMLRHTEDDEMDFGITGTRPEQVHEVLSDPSRSLLLCPGGFSEAVFTDANSEVEYAYLKDRKGFIKLAITHNRDIVPIYQFGVSKLYHTFTWFKGLRAKLAQQLRFPMVIWTNFLNQPCEFKVVTMFGPPFQTRHYGLHQINQAHADYLIHLTNFYNQYRKEFGMGDKELKIVGKDFEDIETVRIRNAMNRISNLVSQVTGRKIIAPNSQMIEPSP